MITGAVTAALCDITSCQDCCLSVLIGCDKEEVCANDFHILAYNVASDTHEVVKHMITLENTFDWYNTESNLRRVYIMYISIALAS